jgi:hypothetical protein
VYPSLSGLKKAVLKALFITASLRFGEDKCQKQTLYSRGVYRDYGRYQYAAGNHQNAPDEQKNIINHI